MHVSWVYLSSSCHTAHDVFLRRISQSCTSVQNISRCLTSVGFRGGSPLMKPLPNFSGPAGAFESQYFDASCSLHASGTILIKCLGKHPKVHVVVRKKESTVCWVVGTRLTGFHYEKWACNITKSITWVCPAPQDGWEKGFFRLRSQAKPGPQSSPIYHM